MLCQLPLPPIAEEPASASPHCADNTLSAAAEACQLATTCWATMHGVASLVVAGQLGPLDAAGAEMIATMVSETLLVGLASR